MKSGEFLPELKAIGFTQNRQQLDRHEFKHTDGVIIVKILNRLESTFIAKDNNGKILKERSKVKHTRTLGFIREQLNVGRVPRKFGAIYPNS